MKEGSIYVKITGYYPSDSPEEGGYEDCVGNPLRTLSDYDRNSDYNNYVSLAVDPNVIAKGCLINIDGFEDEDGEPILFYACDVGGAIKGYHVDICCGSEQQTYNVDSDDNEVELTIVGFQELY
jgi:3D (Asp-Asp-Asp) domain-containing protein